MTVILDRLISIPTASSRVNREEASSLAAVVCREGQVTESILDSGENCFFIELILALPQVCQVTFVDTVLCIARGRLGDAVTLLPFTAIVNELKLPVICESQIADTKVELRGVACLHRVLDS